jgi:ABC-2 type transport system ATP-binding protein
MSKNGIAGDSLAIEARGLVKVYGETRALDGIDLQVRRGQVFGFLGPNGAGKTTTIRILATLSRPDGGTPVSSDSTWCERGTRSGPGWP